MNDLGNVLVKICRIICKNRKLFCKILHAVAYSNFEFGAVQKCVDLVDLVKSFPTDSYSNVYLLAKIGIDTAENEPSKVLNFIPTQAI